MLQALRPTDFPLRRPVPLTVRSIAATTLLVLVVVAVVTVAAHFGV